MKNKKNMTNLKMYSFLLMSISLLIISCDGGSQESESNFINRHNKRGVVDSTGAVINGKHDGAWKFWDEDGRLMVEGHYKNGLMHGEWRYYFPNGQLDLVGTFENNLQEGLFITYFENNGNKFQEVLFEKGYRQGVSRSYFETGKIRSEETFVNDLKHGPAKYYFETGKIASEGNFKNDKEHGIVLTYYHSGALREEATWEEGFLVGKFKSYHKNGKIEVDGEVMEDGKLLKRHFDEMAILKEKKSNENAYCHSCIFCQHQLWPVFSKCRFIT